MKRRTLLTAGGSSILTLGLGNFALNRSGEQSSLMIGAANAQTVSDTLPDVVAMVIGDPDAPIHMLEYSSFTCPHCATFHADSFSALKTNYIDTGKIQFVFREVYFDRPSLWASMIARSQNSIDFFFGFSDLLFQKQREWLASGDSSVVVQELRTLAKTAGLNDATLDECLSNGTQAQKLYAWYEGNAASDEIDSAPSFLIDGEKYSNMNYDSLVEILDAKLT